MSDPTKELERQALLGKFKHGGNPVLGWMNSNATVVNDAAGNIKLEKPGPASPFKIDGLIVCVEAMYSYLQAKRAKPNAYSTRKPDFVRTR
jgi:phage terminase large subunit-like protein